MSGFVGSEPLAKAWSYAKRVEAFVGCEDCPCFQCDLAEPANA